MTALSLSAALIQALAAHGLLALGAALLLGPLGLPLPTALLVLAAGALARQGMLDLPAAAAVALLATVAGDSAAYALGRFAGGWAQRWQGRSRRAAWGAARERLQRHGALALYLTRTLLTALDVPANLVAGSTRYGYRRFLACDLAGRATWLALYGGLGYAAGNQWQAVGQAIQAYGGWLAAAAAAVLALSWLIRRRPTPSLRAPAVQSPPAQSGIPPVTIWPAADLPCPCERQRCSPRLLRRASLRYPTGPPCHCERQRSSLRLPRAASRQ